MNKFDIIFDVARMDFKIMDTDVFKSENICSVQLGSLNGGIDIGIDFEQFVKGELEFSVDTFKSHILERLTNLNCIVNKIEVEQNELDGSMKIGVR